MTGREHPPGARGLIAWAVENRVTPNLLMIFLLVGGLFMTTRIKQEVFPEFELDAVTVRVAYPGASPEDTHQGQGYRVRPEGQHGEGVFQQPEEEAEPPRSPHAHLPGGQKECDGEEIWSDAAQPEAQVEEEVQDGQEHHAGPEEPTRLHR